MRNDGCLSAWLAQVSLCHLSTPNLPGFVLPKSQASAKYHHVQNVLPHFHDRRSTLDQHKDVTLPYETSRCYSTLWKIQIDTSVNRAANWIEFWGEQARNPYHDAALHSRSELSPIQDFCEQIGRNHEIYEVGIRQFASKDCPRLGILCTACRSEVALTRHNKPVSKHENSALILNPILPRNGWLNKLKKFTC